MKRKSESGSRASEGPYIAVKKANQRYHTYCFHAISDRYRCVQGVIGRWTAADDKPEVSQSHTRSKTDNEMSRVAHFSSVDVPFKFCRFGATAAGPRRQPHRQLPNTQYPIPRISHWLCHPRPNETFRQCDQCRLFHHDYDFTPMCYLRCKDDHAMDWPFLMRSLRGGFRNPYLDVCIYLPYMLYRLVGTTCSIERTSNTSSLHDFFSNGIVIAVSRSKFTPFNFNLQFNRCPRWIFGRDDETFSATTRGASVPTV